MRSVEGELSQGIDHFGGALHNPVIQNNINRTQDQDADSTQRMVSRAVVKEDRLLHRSLESLSENINIRQLDDAWRGEIVRRARIPQPNQIVNEDYFTTFRLAEDIIVIIFVNDYREGVYRFQYSIQIIWNSRFSWREIMQHLRKSTYHFNFLVEHIHMDIQNNYNNIGSEEIFNHSTREVEIVDGFPDIENHEYAFSEMICSFLLRPFYYGHRC